MKYLLFLLLCLPVGAFAQKGKKQPQRQRFALELYAADMGAGHWLFRASFEDVLLKSELALGDFTAQYSIYKKDGQLLKSANLGNLNELPATREEDGFGFAFGIMLGPGAYQIRLQIASAQHQLQQSLWFANTAALPFHWENASMPNLPYLRVGDTLRTHHAHWLSVYARNESPADHPLKKNLDTTAVRHLEKRLHIDSLFVPEVPMLLLLQADTAQAEGLYICAVPKDFPKFGDLSNLAASLGYIATREEIDGLMAAPDLKGAIDRFWLERAQESEVTAQRLLKAYYQRIAHANHYFTSYKEGWKTDRGMVYAVFGKPHAQYVQGNTEQWVYYRQAPDNKQVVFEFAAGTHLPNHYTLIRKYELGLPWYAKVEMWRTAAQRVFE